MQPQYITLHPNAKDISGQVFHRLTALGPVGRTNGRVITWLFRCECGNTIIASGASVKFGNTKSCGCLQAENRHANATHGMSQHPLYKIWTGIIKRCTNPNFKGFKNYGGRGITLCDEWRHDFLAFYDYVSQLEHCGEKGYSLDRIDNNQGYAPGNLRFATRLTQSENSRRPRMITIDGETKSLSQWRRDRGLSKHTVSARLRNGWSIEKALTPKPSHR